MQSKFLFLLVFLCLIGVCSCAGPQWTAGKTKGVYHHVKKGETAYSIARAYQVTLKELADENGLEDPAKLKEGTVLFIPRASFVIEDVMERAKNAPLKTNSAEVSEKKEAVEEKKEQEIVVQSKERNAQTIAPQSQETSSPDSTKFIWPVKGQVKTRFGRQPNKTFHNWIKIVAPEGTPVRAAADGTVIFSSQLKDYGETVIIRHENNFTTVYTHLQKRQVRADQSIRQGETVALVGEKDVAGATFIHFEIRLKGKAHDPLLYLP